VFTSPLQVYNEKRIMSAKIVESELLRVFHGTKGAVDALGNRKNSWL